MKNTPFSLLVPSAPRLRPRACFVGALTAALAAFPAAAEAPKAPAGPSVVKSETSRFDFWTVACDTLSQPANAKKCLARLSVNRENSRDVIVNLVVGQNAKGEMRLDVEIPTSVSIQEGVSVKIDGGAEIKLPITFCTPASCVASVPYDAKIAGSMQGTKAAVSWMSLVAGTVKVDFGLKGSREAVAALAK